MTQNSKITVKKAKLKHVPFVLKTEYIKLDNLLKAAGAVNTGGHAKIVIVGGEVKVNSAVCTQRGKKLRPGDTAEYGLTVYEITAEIQDDN